MPFLVELLENGSCIKLTITGSSMLPFFRHGKDFAELIKKPYSEICVLDIVLIQRSSGEYVFHRVVKRTNNECYILGDAQSEIEGPIFPNQIIAVSSGLWRGDKYISSDYFLYKMLVKIWTKMRFCRVYLIKLAYKIISIC